MEGDGKGEHAPTGAGAVVRGEEEEAAAGTIDVGVAGLGDGAENLRPVGRGGGNLDEEVAARKPLAGLAEVGGRRLVAVEPVAVGIEDLDQDIRPDGEGDAGVEEVARVDHDGRAAPAGLKGAQRGNQVVHGAVALEQVHVLDSAEAAVQGSGHDDDGYLGTALAQLGGDCCAELAGSEVVVEDGDVNLIQEPICFLDRGGGESCIAMLAEDCAAQVKVHGVVVEQQDCNDRRADEFERRGCWDLWLHCGVRCAGGCAGLSSSGLIARRGIAVQSFRGAAASF